MTVFLSDLFMPIYNEATETEMTPTAIESSRRMDVGGIKQTTIDGNKDASNVAKMTGRNTSLTNLDGCNPIISFNRKTLATTTIAFTNTYR